MSKEIIPESRELAAVMFTDIVGYTALMGEDEELAFELLRKNREIHDKWVSKFNGKLHKELGDGILCSFPTIFDAVNCAIEIQNAYDSMPELELKIGIHQAEVIYRENDVFGDGVNITSRIQAVAPPGAVYVSEPVFRNISNKKGLISEFVGEKKFKNVKHSIKIYEVQSRSASKKASGNKPATDKATEGEQTNAKKTFSELPRKTKNRVFVWSALILILIITALIKLPAIREIFMPEPSICVFLPDPEKTQDGSFYQDGEEQHKGFKDALQESGNLPNCLEYRFVYMNLDDNADSLMSQMKHHYKESGATFFVMTMSSKIELIRDHFIEWHNTCLKKKKRLPVLIGTVASAPGLADRNSGIVRWYIRSKEESEELAKHLYMKHHVMNAGIFYIVRPGNLDDKYGTSGKIAFDKQFTSPERKIVGSYRTLAESSADKNVSDFIDKVRFQEEFDEKDCGVYVVGYGKMVTYVIDALIDKNFLGRIVCSSTLTESEWQPTSKKLDNQICTVLPRTEDLSIQLNGQEKNVVYYFSRETLKRVVEITSHDPDSRNFIDHWLEQPPVMNKLDQETLYDGDCLIKLDVVDHTRWRQEEE